jgi:hypothetical protein
MNFDTHTARTYEGSLKVLPNYTDIPHATCRYKSYKKCLVRVNALPNFRLASVLAKQKTFTYITAAAGLVGAIALYGFVRAEPYLKIHLFYPTASVFVLRVHASVPFHRRSGCIIVLMNLFISPLTASVVSRRYSWCSYKRE